MFNIMAECGGWGVSQELLSTAQQQWQAGCTGKLGVTF